MAGHSPDRRLDGILHTATAGLRLPAMEGTAVVLEAEGNAHVLGPK